MKFRMTLFIGLGAVLALIVLRLRSTSSTPIDAASPTPSPAVASQSGPHPDRRPVVTPRIPPRQGNPASIGQYLLLPDAMAAESTYARSAVTNLLVMLGISDTIPSAADLSEEQIVAQLTDQGLPPELVEERLRNYPRGNGPISAIYARIARIPGFGPVQAALTGTGFEINPDSECLLECLRFVACNSEVVDFLQGLQRTMSEGPGREIFAPAIAELARDEQDLMQALKRIFGDRFRLRYGMTEQQIDQLLTALAPLRIHGATTQDLYVGRPRRN